MRNSIDYPGERAPRRPAVIAQAGYTGQNHFSVTYGDQKVTVRAEDGYAAIFSRSIAVCSKSIAVLHPVCLDVRDILAGVTHEPHTSAPGRVSGV